jgi:hypothetical protein
MLRVIAHYLDTYLESQSVLLTLRNIEGTHSGQNIGDLGVEPIRGR